MRRLTAPIRSPSAPNTVVPSMRSLSINGLAMMDVLQPQKANPDDGCAVKEGRGIHKACARFDEKSSPIGIETFICRWSGAHGTQALIKTTEVGGSAPLGPAKAVRGLL